MGWFENFKRGSRAPDEPRALPSPAKALPAPDEGGAWEPVEFQEDE